MNDAAAAKRFEDRHFTVRDGLRLHYRDYPGSGGRPPLLCLHGLTRNARDFAELAERYSPRFRVIALEFRGRGKEDSRGGGEDLWVLGSHIIDLIRVFGGDAQWCFATVTSEGRPIPDIIRENAPYMVHFHANDANRLGPGMGDIDFLPIFEALGQINYQGWVSVEVFDYSPGVERLTRESIDYMLVCLNQLAS